MSVDHDVVIAAWLDEGPTALPDDVRLAITSTIRPIPRHRRAVGGPWRYLKMPNSVRLALGAMVVAAVAASGLYLVRPGEPPSIVGGPSIAPTVAGPSIAPTVRPSASPESTWPPDTLPLGSITLSNSQCHGFGFGDRFGPSRFDLAIALLNASDDHGTFGWYRLREGHTWDEALAWTAAANQAIADGAGLPPAGFVTEQMSWEVPAGQRTYMVVDESATPGTHGMLCTTQEPPPGELHAIYLLGPFEVEK